MVSSMVLCLPLDSMVTPFSEESKVGLSTEHWAQEEKHIDICEHIQEQSPHDKESTAGGALPSVLTRRVTA